MKKLFVLIFVVLLVLNGCGTNEDLNSPNDPNGHAGMDHSTSGEVPEGLKEATNPTFKVGSQALIKANHMEGMDGAVATIVGAYDTTVYRVSYTPTTGGERVTNHEWVIHEEVEDAGETPYSQGTEVILLDDHMEGMRGSTATIETAERTTVYMVDYTPTDGGETIMNHKWVTENELTA